MELLKVSAGFGNAAVESSMLCHGLFDSPLRTVMHGFNAAQQKCNDLIPPSAAFTDQWKHFNVEISVK